MGTTHPKVWPGGLCSPRSPPRVLLWPIMCLLAQKNLQKSFSAFGLHLVLIFCDVKNKQKKSATAKISISPPTTKSHISTVPPCFPSSNLHCCLLAAQPPRQRPFLQRRLLAGYPSSCSAASSPATLLLAAPPPRRRPFFLQRRLLTTNPSSCCAVDTSATYL